MELIQMVFWVTEVFPPILDIKPMVSLSRANVFADGEIFLQVCLVMRRLWSDERFRLDWTTVFTFLTDQCQ